MSLGVRTLINKVDQTITQEVFDSYTVGCREHANTITRTIIRITEEHITQGLIDLGWTPPSITPRKEPTTPTEIQAEINRLLSKLTIAAVGAKTYRPHGGTG